MNSKVFFIFSVLIIYSIIVPTYGFIRKSNIFLQDSYLAGDPPGMNAYWDPMQVRTPGDHKVLYGHYSRILEKRRKPDNGVGLHTESLAGRSVLGSLGGHISWAKSAISVISVFKKNLKTVVDAAVNITNGGKSQDFTKQWDSCKSELDKCILLPETYIKCGINCLTKTHPIFKSVADLISTLIELFCKPKYTILDKMGDLQGRGFSQFRSFRAFMETFRAGKKAIGDVAKQAVTAIVPQIVDKVPSEFMPFQLVTKELEKALTHAEGTQPATDSFISNQLCLAIDDRSAMVNLVDVLYRDQNLIDALLGGLSTLNLVSKYIPGNFQVPFASALEGLRLLTGGTCGIIPFATTGSKTKCDEIGGFPTSGIPLPNLPDMPNDADCPESETANSIGVGDDDEDTSNPFRIGSSSKTKAKEEEDKDGAGGAKRKRQTSAETKGKSLAVGNVADRKKK